MALRNKWKETGKNTGKAFGNFGKSLDKTMKVAFTDDENMIEANGHTELSNAWRETGKSFGQASLRSLVFRFPLIVTSTYI